LQKSDQHFQHGNSIKPTYFHGLSLSATKNGGIYPGLGSKKELPNFNILRDSLDARVLSGNENFKSDLRLGNLKWSHIYFHGVS